MGEGKRPIMGTLREPRRGATSGSMSWAVGPEVGGSGPSTALRAVRLGVGSGSIPMFERPTSAP